MQGRGSTSSSAQCFVLEAQRCTAVTVPDRFMTLAVDFRTGLRRQDDQTKSSSRKPARRLSRVDLAHAGSAENSSGNVPRNIRRRLRIYRLPVCSTSPSTPVRPSPQSPGLAWERESGSAQLANLSPPPTVQCSAQTRNTPEELPSDPKRRAATLFASFGRVLAPVRRI
jgi:hypothetical protein